MKKNLNMIRGDTLAFTVKIEGLESALNSCYFSCKKNIGDINYTFQKTLGNGITQIETNKYKIKIDPSDTHDLEVGNYLYDLQIGVGTDIYTIMTGMLNIETEITHEGI